jgi:Rrf2 family protein
VKLSQGVEWALHCCSVLALVPPGHTLTAARLAEFHEVPPAYLAKQLQALARADVIAADPGPKGGYRLARSADRISVLDIVLAVEGDEQAFRCEEVRQRGPAACAPVAYRRPCGIALAMGRAERAWRDELRGTSVADLVMDLALHLHPEAAQKGAAWMQGALR